MPEINVSVRPLTEANAEDLELSGHENYFNISIKDNGIGFSNDSAEDVFRVFYRLNDSSGYEGTGIGLAICRKIAKIHKGLIFASSAPGKGTEINIILPFHQ